MSEAPSEPIGIGEILRAARVAKGLNQPTLARELRMPVHLLAAIEAEDWAQVPTGRERPLARRIATHLQVDLVPYADLWEMLPGSPPAETSDPRRERQEQVLMGILSLGSVALLLWLVVPGRNIKGNQPRPEVRKGFTPAAVWIPNTAPTPYPVLGEVLPEAPVNGEGILLNLRAMDACPARIAAEGPELTRTLQVSEPWTLRVKGPFQLTLDNAGVVTLEVAGRRINHGAAVGEAWTGRFDEAGRLILPPAPPTNLPLHVPQTDPDAPSEE